MSARRPTRRGLLVAGTGSLLAGCSLGGARGPAAQVATGSPSVPPTAAIAGFSASAGTPSPRPWRPDRGDIDPAAKRAAVAVVTAIGSWTGRAGTDSAAGARLAALGETPALAERAGALLGTDDAAVVEIIGAQTGGLLADSASILVFCRQWRRTTSGAASWGGTTVDVRLTRQGTGWRVTGLHPAEPGRPHALTPLERRVLASTRIELPPASVADIRSGQVHDSVLRAMLALSARVRIGVSVVRSGHPVHVFGTDRLSDHSRGRAFDTFRVDGRLVVDPATSQSLVTDLMESAAAAGSDNVGGPYQLAGSGNQFFTDLTHHDHVHAGFSR